jgi:hypothetical protein
MQPEAAYAQGPTGQREALRQRRKPVAKLALHGPER